MRNIFYSLYALLVLSMSGCWSVGPDFVRPDIATPEKWTVEYAAVNDLANTRWWQQFNDPVLDALIAEAVRGNLDIHIATARVDQYLGVLETTRSQYFPRIDGGVSGERSHSNGQTMEQAQAAFTASWEIDLWGRVRRSTEAAQAQIASSEADRRGMIMTIVSSVASNYMVLRGLDQQLLIARETERSYFESLELFQKRFKYGVISQIELSQVESQYQSARQAVPQYEMMIRQQENLLSLLLGRAPGPIPRGKDLEHLISPGIPAGLPSELLERRPDIVAAEQNLVAANAAIGVATAAYFPRLSLTGLLGTASSDLGNFLSSSSGLWSAAGAATAPVLNFGAISGQVKQAEALQQQSLLAYQQAVLTSFKEVEDILIQIVKGNEELAAQQRQVEALSEYARLARLQFEAGTTSYLTVLDAERTLFANKLAQAQLQYSLLVAATTAYKVMGGGWIIEADALRSEKP